MTCYYNDVFEGSTVLVIDIADDGTFYKKFQANYPVHESFYAENSNSKYLSIEFFA